MLNKTLQKYRIRLKDLQKQVKNLDLQITGEEKLYLQSKLAFEQNVTQEIKVDNLEVNMLTYTPDVSKIQDEDIEQIIKQY